MLPAAMVLPPRVGLANSDGAHCQFPYRLMVDA